ncbi:hypothetical protein LTR09_002471 [Extremus antarcticus]|uniref:2EXR domain-containing protein n=1 Tax=Extremus antarcticus TaxID=702011 RepID=A0AAJ0LV42_9PEZI|nr:hypothetical protein LTR09_002471 [Extremus antarcticus]
MSPPTFHFHLFSMLPAELREQIWQYCLPHWFRELDRPVADIVFSLDGLHPCDLRNTTSMNGRPPAISRICHESRCNAFKAGEILPHRPSHEWPVEDRWRHGLENEMSWRDRARDVVHLNWQPACDIEYDHFGSALPSLARDALHNSVGGSLVVECLDPCFRRVYSDDSCDSDEDDPEPTTLRPFRRPLSADVLRDLKTLEQLPKWLVVMRVIVVHSDLKAAAETGLFGLLGDACVQIVDVSEEAKVEAYFQLAETCERASALTITQDFHRECAGSIEQALERSVEPRFRSEKLAEAMRPAIMFRLCANMCNDVMCLEGLDQV